MTVKSIGRASTSIRRGITGYRDLCGGGAVGPAKRETSPHGAFSQWLHFDHTTCGAEKTTAMALKGELDVT